MSHHIEVSLILLLLFMNLLAFYGAPRLLFLGTSVASGMLILYKFGVTYQIKDDKLSKWVYKMRWFEIEISEIELIEFYRYREMGTIRIASRDEDEYRLLLKNREVIRIPHSYMNKKKTVGEYLCKRYKRKKKETKIVVNFLGNPRNESDDK